MKKEKTKKTSEKGEDYEKSLESTEDSKKRSAALQKELLGSHNHKKTTNRQSCELVISSAPAEAMAPICLISLANAKLFAAIISSNKQSTRSMK
jgi:hypothetical protein